MKGKREIYYTQTDTPGTSDYFHLDRFCRSIKTKDTVVSELTTEQTRVVTCTDGHERRACMVCR